MRIREGCILTATNSNDERVKSLIGCKGALHVVNGEPLRFVVGSNENTRSFTTATTKRLGVIGVNIFVSTVTGTEYTFEFRCIRYIPQTISLRKKVLLHGILKRGMRRQLIRLCLHFSKINNTKKGEITMAMVQNRDSSDNKKPSFSRFAKWEFGGFIVDSKTIYMASKPVKALLQSSDFIDDMDVFEKLDSIRIPLFRKNIPADPAMFQDKDTVDKAVRNACSAFLFGTRCNEFSNLIRTMYPLNDDDVIHYLSSPSDWAEKTSSVTTASNGTASRIYYMARLIAIDRMSELFLTFYEHDSADPKDITNVCKSMMDAVEPYKVVTLVMDYIDDKKMGEHLEVDCPSHLIRDADVLRRKGISVTRISAFAKPEATQRFVCKHPNLIKQVEKGTNMFDVFVFPIDCITRIRAGEKVLWTNPTT